MKRIAIIYASIMLVPFVQMAQSSEDSKPARVVQVSLAYPIGSAGIGSVAYSNHFSLNLTYGLNGGVKGLEIGGVGNFNKGKVTGVQIGGVANINTEASSGILLAGTFNAVGAEVNGIQVAGVLNANAGAAKGLMLAGVFNASAGMQGAQISGIANISTQDVKGLQVSGICNSARDVNTQVSGLINRAKTVRGMQIAPLINIADTSDYSIALINLVKSGEKRLSATLDETKTMLMSFRSGGRVLYSILGLGYNFSNEDARYALEGGFGANLLNKEKVRLRTEAAALQLTDFGKRQYFRASLRVLPAIRKENYEVFGGPTFNYVYTDQSEGKELVSNYLWEEAKNGTLNGLYIGFTGGISYTF